LASQRQRTDCRGDPQAPPSPGCPQHACRHDKGDSHYPRLLCALHGGYSTAVVFCVLHLSTTSTPPKLSASLSDIQQAALERSTSTRARRLPISVSNVMCSRKASFCVLLTSGILGCGTQRISSRKVICRARKRNAPPQAAWNAQLRNLYVGCVNTVMFSRKGSILHVINDQISVCGIGTLCKQHCS
jgi:hypothetical protein